MTDPLELATLIVGSTPLTAHKRPRDELFLAGNAARASAYDVSSHHDAKRHHAIGSSPGAIFASSTLQRGDVDECATAPPHACGERDCGERFASVAALEQHYDSRHRHVCASCGDVFLDARLLDIHVQEEHDALFATMAARTDMYVCLVAACGRKFSTPTGRRRHLIDLHGYPPAFRFGRRTVGPPTPCWHFSTRGGCRSGAACKYAHGLPATETAGALSAVGTAGSSAAAPSPASPASVVVCRHVASPGGCRYGASCRFLHPVPPPASSTDSMDVDASDAALAACMGGLGISAPDEVSFGRRRGGRR